MTRSNLKTVKLDSVTQEISQLLTTCRSSGKRVTTDSWQQISVSEDEAIWWKCPECKGWHIVMMHRKGS